MNSDSSPPRVVGDRIVIALIACVTLALYWRARHAGFVGDDFMILHRLRALTGPADALRFFRGEFFEYYRPLAFISHSMDWALAGSDARQFHLTNLLLHVANTLLILFIGRALSPRSLGGPVAALLFAVHASNHEAVVWVSARFDLLATCFSLAAIWSLVRGGAGRGLVPAVLFLAAILSKESAVALPIAAAGFAVFVRRASTRDTALRLIPWLAALAVYGALRQLAGGVSATGGSGRLPKLLALAAILGILLLCADRRWVRLRDWLRVHRARAMGLLAAALAIAACSAALGLGGHLAADKLAVAGFALFHLVSPVVDAFDVPFYLQPESPTYWLGGVIALVAAGAVLAWLWRTLLDDDRMWFLGAFLIATLLPISALTEGARYIYLPSAAFSLIAGTLVAELEAPRRRVAFALVGVVLVISAIQVSVKIQDWIWAGGMTADGARLADEALAPSCGEGHVVFLTEPVAIRGVYTHFYYETLERRPGCQPAVFQILVRIVRLDTHVDVAWDGPSRLVITAPSYRDTFLLSEDLRNFDVALRGTAPVTLRTPLGDLRAERIGSAERLTLDLARDVDAGRIRFFYYSDARMQELPRPK